MTQTASSIIEVLKYIFQQFGIAVDWTAETLMPYIEESISKYQDWKTSVYIFWAIVGAVIIAFGITLLITGISGRTTCDDEQLIGFGVILFIIGLILACVFVTLYFKVSKFPELAFIEWASNLLKSRR